MPRGATPGSPTLTQAARPKAALEFPFVPAMRELVVAAAEQEQLANMTPAEWLARVKTLAAPPRAGSGTTGHRYDWYRQVRGTS